MYFFQTLENHYIQGVVVVFCVSSLLHYASLQDTDSLLPFFKKTLHTQSHRWHRHWERLFSTRWRLFLNCSIRKVSKRELIWNVTKMHVEYESAIERSIKRNAWKTAIFVMKGMIERAYWNQCLLYSPSQQPPAGTGAPAQVGCRGHETALTVTPPCSSWASIRRGPSCAAAPLSWNATGPLGKITSHYKCVHNLFWKGSKLVNAPNIELILKCNKMLAELFTHRTTS